MLILKQFSRIVNGSIGPNLSIVKVCLKLGMGPVSDTSYIGKKIAAHTSKIVTMRHGNRVFIMPPPLKVGGAYRFAFVRPSVRPSVRTYVRTSVRPYEKNKFVLRVSLKPLPLQT